VQVLNEQLGAKDAMVLELNGSVSELKIRISKIEVSVALIIV
jgi:hypothetical protein